MRLLGLATVLFSFQVLLSAFATESLGTPRSRGDRVGAPILQEEETTGAYLHRLGLGSNISVSVVFSAEDPTCLKQIDFYRRLLAVPGMDGKIGRLIVFTKDGASPAYRALKDRNLKPHAVGSLPTAAGSLPTGLGSVAIFDKAGAILRSWNGFLSAAQQEDVLELVKRSLQ